MIELFHYEFMRSALAAGLIASIICGIIGVYVILNKVVFISDGIAHAAFGGIGLGYLVGLNPMAFGAISAIATALGIGILTSKRQVSEDTLIGVFLATGMALGILFMSLSKSYGRDLFGYLFGNILAVTWQDILVMTALALIILVLVTLFYKEFLILSFDPNYGQSIGLPVQNLRLLLLCMVAASVIILIKVVGIILLIALLTIPGAISRQHLNAFPKIMLAAILLGAFFVTIGLITSYLLDVPSGATIILTASIMFFFSTIISR